MIAFIVHSITTAAPPGLTGFFPAGIERGTSAELTALGAFDTWPVQTWASDSSITIKPAKDKGKLLVTVAANTVPGIYWIRLVSNDGSSALRPLLVSNSKEIMETEPNDKPEQAAAIDLPRIVNGKLNRNGDVDHVAVMLKKGQTLTAAIEAHQAFRSAADTVLQVVSLNGTVLAQNHDYRGLDPQLIYRAENDQKVMVRVFAFPANPDQSIRLSGGDLFVYRLHLTTQGMAEYALPLASNLEKPVPIRLLSQHQVIQKPHIDWQGDTGIVHHPGMMRYAVVRKEPIPLKDASDSPLMEIVNVPVGISGRLSPSQPEFQFKLQSNKGRKVRIELMSHSLGLEVDPVITIIDSAGKQVHQAQLNSLINDLSTPFVPGDEGVFTVKVRDLHGRKDFRQVFFLRITAELPDYHVHIDKDSFTLNKAKPLEIPLKQVSLAGFSEEVEYHVLGLSAGVQSKVITTGSGDKTKWVLQLQTSQPGIQTPFQIRAVSKKSKLQRLVSASLPDYGKTTNDFWLTTIQ